MVRKQVRETEPLATPCLLRDVRISVGRGFNARKGQVRDRNDGQVRYGVDDVVFGVQNRGNSEQPVTPQEHGPALVNRIQQG